MPGTETDRTVLALFLEALEVEDGERETWLRQRTAADLELGDAVRRMLREDGRRSDDTAPFRRPLELAGSASLLGDALGPFRLTGLLGVGGMGEVYVGEREDEFEQRVAVKVVRQDVQEAWNLEQLERERQILARLDHPNIARLLDGGRAPDGAPYLVMELVEGEPITRFVRRQGYAVPQILRLFLDVCSAVEAAHNALLVHGDLKPGNILVTDAGIVKLLDFGVARILGEEPTRGSLRALTPAYASPEQLRRSPLTVASDVYSLGVLLYQLLTGRLPAPPPETSDPAALARIVETTVVPPPSEVREGRLAATAPGRGAEIDAVVLAAIAPDPADRYASVGELADECRRLLEGRPVQALPQRWTYLLRKFAVRHRSGVAAGLLAVVALTATTAYAVRQERLARSEARESDRQRQVAERERARAESVTAFLLDLFEAANVDSEEAIASDVRVTDVLDRASERLDADRELAWEARFDLRLTLLELEQSLHRFAPARELARAALRDLAQSGETSALREGWVHRGLGLTETGAGDFGAAEAAYRRALELVAGAEDREPPEVELSPASYDARGYGKLENSVRLELAGLLMYQDRCDEALDLIDPVLRQRDRMTSRDGLIDLANAANQVSGCAAKRGDSERAWQLLVEARELMERGAGPRSAATATILSNLGQEARLQGRCRQAIEPLEAAVAIREELGVDERDNLRLRGSLAFCLAELGRVQPARAQLAIAINAAESLPDGHFRKAGGYTVIGRTLSLLGEPAAATPFLEKTLEWQLAMAPESPYVETLEYFLAENLVDRGRAEEGARELERLLEIFVAREQPPGRGVRRAATTLLRAYEALDQQDRAAGLRSRFGAVLE